MSHKSVFAIVNSTTRAEQIVERLQASGFSSSDISVLLPDTHGKHDMGHVKATKAPEGATTGGVTGGLAGGVIGLLAGIGALAIPGLGPFIAAGPIMAALSGASIGAATGGLVGGLVGLGIPEIEAKRYEDKLRNGNFLIAVDADDNDAEKRAKEIFKASGAEDISTYINVESAIRDNCVRRPHRNKVGAWAIGAHTQTFKAARRGAMPRVAIAFSWSSRSFSSMVSPQAQSKVRIFSRSERGLSASSALLKARRISATISF